MAVVNIVRCPTEKIATFRHDYDGFNLTGAVLSPDGARVAYGVYERKADGGTFARVHVWSTDGGKHQSFDAAEYTPTESFSGSAAFLPDGRLVFSRPTGFAVADAALTKADPLGPQTLANPSNPAVSPDGAYLLFDQARGANIGKDTAYRAVWCLELSSGAVFQLTRGVIEEYVAGFSPDGRYVLFRTAARSRSPGSARSSGPSSASCRSRTTSSTSRTRT